MKERVKERVKKKVKMTQHRCDVCKIVNFISTIDIVDLDRFCDIMEEIDIDDEFDTVCDSCKYKIMYQYYYKKVRKIKEILSI